MSGINHNSIDPFSYRSRTLIAEFSFFFFPFYRLFIDDLAASLIATMCQWALDVSLLLLLDETIRVWPSLTKVSNLDAHIPSW